MRAGQMCSLDLRVVTADDYYDSGSTDGGDVTYSIVDHKFIDFFYFVTFSSTYVEYETDLP